ncbi:putative conserved lipoprotein LppL [Mycobacterium ulcerans str. Harvey]|uniref:Conserved lipoprotein LppL n=1 Tax=Mycobacterium ulcerans str. Harvey TaxID=1299332 RepID=A0ABN0QYE9_MYCUL|nr:putative conserved lipoprotein LppL [Mycobacterium ulcerans str. Harvey]
MSDSADTEFTAIARRMDGKLVLGTADGALYTLASPQTPASAGTAQVLSRIKIFARVDAVVTQGNTAVVLDRGQTSVTTIDADGRAEQALRAGEGRPPWPPTRWGECWSQIPVAANCWCMALTR